MELAGGTLGVIDLVGFTVDSVHPKAPAYRIKFYPKDQSGARRPAPALARPGPAQPALGELTDDDIPF